MNRRKFIKSTSKGAVLLLTTSAISNSSQKSFSDKNVNKVLDYIHANWERSFYNDEPGKGFGKIDLPYTYSSPCIKGEGQYTFFFYWDTYFTNLGLLRDGHVEQAKNNIKNMLWLINEQGYMPNHVGLHNRSQTPYLQLMIQDYFDKVHAESIDFYKECAEGLRKEYQFWMTARYSISGLNHFGHHEVAGGCIKFYNDIGIKRLNLPLDIPDDEKIVIGGNLIAEAENWDFTQRYGHQIINYNSVDLNALLWGYEEFLYKVSQKLGWFFTDFYNQRAIKRKELINKFLWNNDLGWFFDYNYVTKKQSDIYSISGILPMFVGLASDEQAAQMVKNLPFFEKEFGIATTKEHPGCRDYQWAYPVVWPPMVYLTVMALDRYDYKAEAVRIANKYINVNTEIFKQYGKLYEKSDAETGKLSNAEYESPGMMGWTAGVYVALAEYLGLK